jgi:hypothetical protein
VNGCRFNEETSKLMEIFLVLFLDGIAVGLILGVRLRSGKAPLRL